MIISNSKYKKKLFVILMCLRSAQTHENNKVYFFIRKVSLYFELLNDHTPESGCESCAKIDFVL